MEQSWVSLKNLGKYDEALAAYNKSIEIKSTAAKTWTNKGIAFYNLGKYDEALAAFENETSIDPRYPNAWHNKGLALTKLNKPDEAITAYQKEAESQVIGPIGNKMKLLFLALLPLYHLLGNGLILCPKTHYLLVFFF